MRLVSTCFVLGFNPNRQLSSTQPLVHPPHERIKKVNVWELVDRDKDSLQSRVKAVYTSKTRILLLLPIGRQMLSHSQENRRKKKKSRKTCITLALQMPHPSPFPSLSRLLLLYWWPHHCMKYPSGQFGPVVLSSSPATYSPMAPLW